MERSSIQFLLVVVPVVSLIGSWLALRVIGDRRDRKPGDEGASVHGRPKVEKK